MMPLLWSARTRSLAATFVVAVAAVAIVVAPLIWLAPEATTGRAIDASRLRLDVQQPVTTTATVTPTASATAVLTATPEVTATFAITVVPTVTLEPTAFPTPTLPISPTLTPSVPPTATLPSTPTLTAIAMTLTPEVPPTPPLTATATSTPLPSPTATTSGTVTATPTITMAPPVTTTAVATPTPTLTGPTPPLTVTTTPTDEPTEVGEPTATARVRQGLPFAANAPEGETEEVATGVQIQNLDPTSPVAIEVDLVDETGRVRQRVVEDVAAGAAPNIYLPTLGQRDGLPLGLYSLVVRSTGPVGSIVRTDWTSSGAAAIYSGGRASRDVVVPRFERRVAGRSSVLSVQNASAVTASVAITLYGGADGSLNLTHLAFELRPFAARHVFAAHEAALQSLGSFEGWARVHASQPVAVAHHALSGRRLPPPRVAFADASPVRDQAAAELVVPLFRSDQRVLGDRERLNTRIAVVNPSPVSATVRTVYFGSRHPDASAACRGGVFQHPPVVIPAGGRIVLDQAPGGGHDLPGGCFGTARLTTASAEQRIAAEVLDVTDDGRLLSAYGALTSADASHRMYLPLFRRAYAGLTTGIQVMNLGAVTATIRIDFRATDPRTNETRSISTCGRECEQQAAPSGSVTWWPGSLPAIPDNTFGGAVVRSDQPIIVLVNDYPLIGGRDPATYLGIVGR